MKAKQKSQDAALPEPAKTPDDVAPAQAIETSPLPTTDAPAVATVNEGPEPTVTPNAVKPEVVSVAPTIALPKAAPQYHEARNQAAARTPEQVQAVIAKIKADAESLSDAQRSHLKTAAVANPMRDLNARCFADVHTFRHMTILFSNLRANSKAFLSIRPDQFAIWSEGGAKSRMVGLSFCATVQPTMYLRNFLINAREMYLETYDDCTAIELTLYVRTEQHQLKGKVDLPPGASVTLTSRSDRTSVIGLSSFGIDLE